VLAVAVSLTFLLGVAAALAFLAAWVYFEATAFKYLRLRERFQLSTSERSELKLTRATIRQHQQAVHSLQLNSRLRKRQDGLYDERSIVGRQINQLLDSLDEEEVCFAELMSRPWQRWRAFSLHIAARFAFRFLISVGIIFGCIMVLAKPKWLLASSAIAFQYSIVKLFPNHLELYGLTILLGFGGWVVFPAVFLVYRKMLNSRYHADFLSHAHMISPEELDRLEHDHDPNFLRDFL
jgi:hypothetical protein